MLVVSSDSVLLFKNHVMLAVEEGEALEPKGQESLNIVPVRTVWFCGSIKMVSL